MRMSRMLVSVMLAGMSACAVLPLPQQRYAPQQTTVTLPLPPAAAYQRAYRTFARQPGWIITGAVEPLHTFHGIVHNAAHIAVLIEAHPPGSLVTIQGSILPNKVVVGEFTEVFEYAELLRQVP